MEREQNSKLPFLDQLISRDSSGNLSFAVYRKPSHTGNYLKFNSNHPFNHKRAVVKNLCSASELKQEINLIKSTLQKNGYPIKFCYDQINNETR